MKNQEPQYKRKVFEGLLNALDVVLTDNSNIHMPDDTVRGNYDIQDDGVWLRKNDAVPAFNWTPVCDLEEGPESPDPLTTPALPFPFTARQLAAFTLGGWGWFLGQRFADGTGMLDTEVVPLLLDGSPDNTKLRESITAAFSALQNARLNAPIPDPELERKLVKTQEECEAAVTAAEATYDWGDMNQQEAVREKRRLAYLAAVNPYRNKKREAQVAYDEAQEAWRKAMVRELLQPQKDADAALQAAPMENTVNAPVKARRNLLTPVIEAAQKNCVNPLDPPEVWASLVLMAGTGKLPLLGVSDDGIKWQDANDEPQFLTLKNLSDRLRRSKKKHSEAR